MKEIFRPNEPVFWLLIAVLLLMAFVFANLYILDTDSQNLNPPFSKWIFDYQILLTGLFALGAAGLGLTSVVFTTRADDQREREKRDADDRRERESRSNEKKALARGLIGEVEALLSHGIMAFKTSRAISDRFGSSVPFGTTNALQPVQPALFPSVAHRVGEFGSDVSRELIVFFQRYEFFTKVMYAELKGLPNEYVETIFKARLGEIAYYGAQLTIIFQTYLAKASIDDPKTIHVAPTLDDIYARLAEIYKDIDILNEMKPFVDPESRQKLVVEHVSRMTRQNSSAN